MEFTQPECPSKGAPTIEPVSASHIRMVASNDAVAMWHPLGEWRMQEMVLVCPIHFNGGAGHDNIFPFCMLMPLLNNLLKMVDKGDCDGRKGRVEIYVCGALTVTGGPKVMIK